MAERQMGERQEQRQPLSLHAAMSRRRRGGSAGPAGHPRGSHPPTPHSTRPPAAGLSLAVRSGMQAQSGGDVGRVMVVLITDGRANVSLGKSNDDPDACAPDAPKPSQVRAALCGAALRLLRGACCCCLRAPEF